MLSVEMVVIGVDEDVDGIGGDENVEETRD